MRPRTVLITAVLLGACTKLVVAGEQKQAGTGTAPFSAMSVSENKNRTEEARERKKLGDAFAAKDDDKRAADEYVRALSLNAAAFTEEERIRMAIVVSWAGRFDKAIGILRSVLAENPENREARTQLAKFLSWSDRPGQAQAEADTVLRSHPDDPEALLVKANVLRWRGEAAASIPFYERVLSKGENFDARLGLAHAYLSIGKKEKAREIGRTLKPALEAQRKELTQLREALGAAAEGLQQQGAAGGAGQSVDAEKSKVAEARERKRRGDELATQGDNKRAAEEYKEALSADASAFTGEERLHMATVISWARDFEESARILRAILEGDPSNTQARLYLAKVLSWSGQLNEAQAEVEKVLKATPDEQEALLAKANILRWRGEAATSIPLYERVLSRGESFDARLGLSYAYLDAGKKDKAQEIGKTLTPSSEAQRKEVATFSDALSAATASHIGLQASYYRDSDDNTVKRSGLVYGFWAGNWESELTYWLIEAKDPDRHEWSETFSITARRHEGGLSTGVRAGVSSTAGGTSNDIFGQASADISRGWWTVGLNASRDVLSDTAELVQNRIKRTAGTVTLSETASSRWTFAQNYTRAGYSDSNDLDDLGASVRYTALTVPARIATGYRFRYWNFRRQSGGGYFDPKDFISHQIFFSLSVEREGFHASLEPYTGYQSFKRYGETSGNYFAGYSASAGWTRKKNMSGELTAEGGNYAVGSTAGFNYYQVGFRLTVSF
jgi:tetratricopeptide (TPR) repeat protein